MIEQRGMFVTVANGPTYGGGMRIAPDARLDDGLLDLVFVRKVSKTKLLRVFPRVYSGEHVDLPEAEILAETRIRASGDLSSCETSRSSVSLEVTSASSFAAIVSKSRASVPTSSSTPPKCRRTRSFSACGVCSRRASEPDRMRRGRGTVAAPERHAKRSAPTQLI